MRRLLLTLSLFLIVPACAQAGTIDPLIDQQWGYARIGAGAAHAVATGRGVTVAVIDSGIDASHPDLAGRVLPGKSFVGGNPAVDVLGHGTHVAGLIAAREDDGHGIAGVAPAARLLPLQVLDANGGGRLSSVANAIDYAREQGAQVINLSLTPEHPASTVTTQLQAALDALTQGSGVAAALQRAVDADIVVVDAAGNDALPFCELPSLSGKVLCVGATTRTGKLAPFSDYGAGVSLVAPGGDATDAPAAGRIVSTLPGGGYGGIAGTSQAAPLVSGVAALLAERGVRGQAAVARILASTRDLGSAGADLVYGRGELDASRAVAGLSGAAHVSVPSAQPASNLRSEGLMLRIVAPAGGVVQVAGTDVLKRSLRLRAGVPRLARLRVARRVLVHGDRTLSVRITLPGNRRVTRRVHVL